MLLVINKTSQKDHLHKIFKAAQCAGWLPADEGRSLYPKASHVGFGLVCGADAKPILTRCANVVRLVDLLDEVKNRSKAALIERGKAKGKKWG